MSRRLPPSPGQVASFSMARALLTLAAWERACERPVEFDRWMLLDFGIQYPSLIGHVVPELALLARAAGLSGEGVADLFARSRFGILRHHFSVITTGLIARDVVKEEFSAASPTYSLLPRGSEVEREFSSAYGLAVRSAADVLSREWKSWRIARIRKTVASTLPESSAARAELTRPFAEWLVEARDA